MKAQDNSDDEVVGDLHTKRKSPGGFPGTGFIYHDSAQPTSEELGASSPAVMSDHSAQSGSFFFRPSSL